MAVTWVTEAGDLGVLNERVQTSLDLQATSDAGDITYSVIAGNLPRGLRISGSQIIGSPAEVQKYTQSRFVIRASDANDEKDRTFSLAVDGADQPEWVTPEGFLQVGIGESYFVLDNANVDFQLEVYDPDVVAGDTLEFYLLPNSGILPPGLTLSSTGKISGFTDPIFSVVYADENTGAYDTASFDIQPHDIASLNSNGFDTFLYDGQTFDYSEPSRTPKRLSRLYAFTVAVSDGEHVISRLFKIYVVTEEFLKADNNLIQVDTNIFRADSDSNRVPFWITDPYLGRWRANNYVTIPLDVYDPPSLPGAISYVLEATNPDDGSNSVLPPGMSLSSITGNIAGIVPYQAAVTKNYKFTVNALNFDTATLSEYTLVGDWNSSTTYLVNQAVRYAGIIYVALEANKNKVPETNTTLWRSSITESKRTFNVDVIGEIESAIEWVSDSDLGTIKPNQPSRLEVVANTSIYGNRITYELVSGSLPPGLIFLPSGLIEGKINQFADSDNDGLTRFYDRDSSLIDSTGSRSFNTSFDGGTTDFDRVFSFTVRAKDYAQVATSDKTFSVTVNAASNLTFANIYLKALQSKQKRLNWFNFITDATIFKPSDIYRFGDPNFSVQTDLRVLLFAGIESVEAQEYISAMGKNHFRKRILFGDLKKGIAKDPVTQETVYEVVYVDIRDQFETKETDINLRKSISSVVELADNIESKVLVSYDAIKVDSNIPFASDADHQRIFPNSFKNMRSRIESTGERDRDFLPLWMRSIQETSNYELGYTKALVLCYAKPGRADSIMARIRANGFDFKSIDFVSDRYIIDILNGEIEDKYLAFPQRGEKLP